MSSKTFTLYTSTDDATKKLRGPTQILLTVTPRDQSQLFGAQTPIAWQVLAFGPNSDLQATVTWHSSSGFSCVTVDEDNILRPGISAFVPVRTWVQLQNVAGTYQWTKSQTLNAPGEELMARNECGVPKTFALGSVDPSFKFEPFVHFKSAQNRRAVTVGPAVLLQAYAVSGYKKNQMLSQANKDDFIFATWQGNPEPVDITSLGQSTSWLLYSDPSGKLVLESEQ